MQLARPRRIIRFLIRRGIPALAVLGTIILIVYLIIKLLSRNKENSDLDANYWEKMKDTN